MGRRDVDAVDAVLHAGIGQRYLDSFLKVISGTHEVGIVVLFGFVLLVILFTNNFVLLQACLPT